MSLKTEAAQHLYCLFLAFVCLFDKAFAQGVIAVRSSTAKPAAFYVCELADQSWQTHETSFMGTIHSFYYHSDRLHFIGYTPLDPAGNVASIHVIDSDSMKSSLAVILRHPPIRQCDDAIVQSGCLYYGSASRVCEINLDTYSLRVCDLGHNPTSLVVARERLWVSLQDETVVSVDFETFDSTQCGTLPPDTSLVNVAGHELGYLRRSKSLRDEIGYLELGNMVEADEPLTLEQTSDLMHCLYRGAASDSITLGDETFAVTLFDSPRSVQLINIESKERIDSPIGISWGGGAAVKVVDGQQ